MKKKEETEGLFGGREVAAGQRVAWLSEQSLLPGVMSSSGDGAVTAQPDGIYVPITTSLLFCINLRHKHTLTRTPAVPFPSWFCTVDSIRLLGGSAFFCV